MAGFGPVIAEMSVTAASPAVSPIRRSRLMPAAGAGAGAGASPGGQGPWYACTCSVWSKILQRLCDCVDSLCIFKQFLSGLLAV